MDARIELTDIATSEIGEAQLNAGVGVTLGSLFASTSCAVLNADSVALRPIHPSCDLIPPSILLPRLSGEPLRLDFQTPAHPRGLGQPWPPESALKPDEQGARFPLAYALQGFAQGKREPWNWTTPEGEVRRATSAEAIAGAFAATIERAGLARGPSVLVIPNHLSMDRQQELIDACWSFGCQVKLLWRPIAAALVWCQTHNDKVFRNLSVQANANGTLLCLHLGIDDFEISLLDLVRREANGQHWLLPARRRPSAALRPHSSFGMELLHRLATNDHAQPIDQRLKERTWGALWSSQWPVQTLKRIRKDGRDLNGSSLPLDHCLRILNSIGTRDWQTAAWASEWLRLSGTTLERSEWLRRAADEIAQHRIVGVVVTGELASICSSHGRCLAEDFVSKLVQSPPEDSVVIDDEARRHHSLLADGASLYSAQIAVGQPTYLDTLPRIQLGTYITGKPGWLPLLNDADTYVDGGRIWHRPKPVSGLRALAGSESLEVTLWHDEFETARRLNTSYPTKLPRDVSILLDVSVEPAQGNARVEVVPDTPTFFGSRRVFMEWRKMEVLPETPEQWLESNLPTLFPNLLRRAASSFQWELARREIDKYLSLKQPTQEHLTRIIERLRQKDSNVRVGPNEESSQTAVSSDGQAGSDKSTSLEDFVNVAVAKLLSARRAPNPDLIRALAYTSTDNADFQAFLAQRIREAGTLLAQQELAACGWCLRAPTHIAEFADRLLRRLQSDLNGTNLWLKAFGEILRYRDDATRDIETTRCEELTRYLLRVLDNQRRAGNAQFLFRNSCVCIVYLLRRRAFDDDFLRPGSKAYDEARHVFMAAIAGFGGLQTIGGAINVRGALTVMMNYLDRKGPPILRGGIELRGLVE